MSADLDHWIVIPGWEKFQHYRDRTPPWIKNYTSLLQRDSYLELTAAQRSLLHGVWLLYAMGDGQLRVRTLSVLKLRYRRSDVDALNDAGYLRLRASKPLSRLQAKHLHHTRARKRVREETETETEKKSKRKSEKPNPELLNFQEYLTKVQGE